MFHELILHDELSRCGSMGVAIGTLCTLMKFMLVLKPQSLIAGFAIYTMALPPIVNHASEYIKNKVNLATDCCYNC